MARAIVTPLLKLIRNPKTGSTEWQFSLIDEPHAMSITECDSFSDGGDNKPSSVDQRVPGSDNKQVKITAGTPVGEWPLRLLTDSVLGRYVVASETSPLASASSKRTPLCKAIPRSVPQYSLPRVLPFFDDGGLEGAAHWMW